MTHVLRREYLLAGVVAFCLFALTPLLTHAAGPDKVSAFVCPVIPSSAVGENNPNAVPLGSTGTYTVAQPTSADGGNLMVPVTATNGDGTGVPGGPQSAPGDTDYTAIWAHQ